MLISACSLTAVPLSLTKHPHSYVKNRVRRGWDLSRGQRSASTSTAGISDNDRSSLKSALLPALASVPERLRVHVQATLLSVITVDFPSAWPELMPQIGLFLQSGEAASVHAGVRALLQVVAAFRWKDESGISESIIASSFPALLTTAKALLDSPQSSSPDSGSILHAILKTYARSMQSRLSQHQMSQESIVPWGMLMLQVVQKDVDPAQLPEDADEREKAPWWKAKKWAFYCLNRLFSKYGNPSQLPKTMLEYKPFAEGFVQRFAPEILKVYIRLTEAHAQRNLFLTKRAVVSLFRFYDDW